MQYKNRMFTTCKWYVGKGNLYVFSTHKEEENEAVILKSDLIRVLLSVHTAED